MLFPNTIQSYEAGGLPRGTHFLAVAKVLGCSLNWLVGMNDVGGFGGHSDQFGTDSDALMNTGQHFGRLDYFFKPPFLSNSGEDASVRRGAGFSYQWLSGISSKPEDAMLYVFKGPAMQPTLSDGDLLMVDLGRTEIHSGYLYLIKLYGTQSINRLIMKPGNNLSVVSDNQYLCSSFDLTISQVKVLGRII